MSIRYCDTVWVKRLLLSSGRGSTRVQIPPEPGIIHVQRPRHQQLLQCLEEGGGADSIGYVRVECILDNHTLVKYLYALFCVFAPLFLAGFLNMLEVAKTCVLNDMHTKIGDKIFLS